MRRFTVASLMIAMLLAVQTNAISQEGKSATGLVAVLDVNKVFKEHDAFNAQMDALKKEVEAFDAQMKQKAEVLRQEMAALNKDGTFAPSSPEYKAAQADLARKDADMKILANQKRQEILDKEARVYLTTYTEVQNIVSQLANEYGITLVMRYDSEPIVPSNRQSVIKGVNRPIIFQRNLDLTNHVIPKVKTRTAQK